MTRRVLLALIAVLALTATGCGADRHAGAGSAIPRAAPPRAGVSMFFPAWSRDRSRIAWTQPTGGGKAQVWVASANGSQPHAIAKPIEALSQIAWLPSNEIVYWAAFKLFRLSLAGTSSLVAGVEGERFSLDARGNRVATGPPGCPFCAGPVVIDDLETGARRVIGDETDGSDSPSLSPDGSRVAFRRFRCARPDDECEQVGGLWVSATAGGPAREITKAGSCPTWSPDGRTLLYVGRDDSVRLVPAAGGPSRLLLRTGRCSAAFPPSWSPDGRRVALFQGRPGRLLTVDVATRRTSVVAGVVVGFAWSPDSSSLLVAARPVPLACSSLQRISATTGASHLLRAC